MRKKKEGKWGGGVGETKGKGGGEERKVREGDRYMGHKGGAWLFSMSNVPENTIMIIIGFAKLSEKKKCEKNNSLYF